MDGLRTSQPGCHTPHDLPLAVEGVDSAVGGDRDEDVAVGIKGQVLDRRV